MRTLIFYGLLDHPGPGTFERIRMQRVRSAAAVSLICAGLIVGAQPVGATPTAVQAAAPAAETHTQILEDSHSMYRERVVVSASEHYMIEWNKQTDLVAVTNQNGHTRTGTMEEIRQIQQELNRLGVVVEEVPAEVRESYPQMPREFEDSTVYLSGNASNTQGTAYAVQPYAADPFAGSFSPNAGSVSDAAGVVHYLQGVNGCQVATGAAGIAHGALWGAALGGVPGALAGAAVGAFWWGVGTQC